MSGWPFVDLAEVSDISAGNPAPQGAPHFSDDGAPFVRMQDVGRTHINPTLTETVGRVSPSAIRECGLRLYPAGTLLIPNSGASVNLNHRAMLGTEAYVVSHLATIIPDQGKVLPSYLFHWSRLYDPRAQAQVTSLPSLPLSLIKTAKVPLPPLDEQRRIVALLDRAEAIRRRADTARKAARALIPALFTKTFGDPATNPKGWEVVMLDKITTRPMKTNPSESCAPTFRYIDIASIDPAMGAVTKAKIVASVAAPSRARQLVAADDVLVSTVRPNLRGSAHVPEVFDGSIASTGFAALRLVGNHINPKYLFALIRCDWFVEMLSNNVRGASYPAVTDSFVRSVAVPLPPSPCKPPSPPRPAASRPWRAPSTPPPPRPRPQPPPSRPGCSDRPDPQPDTQPSGPPQTRTTTAAQAQNRRQCTDGKH